MKKIAQIRMLLIYSFLIYFSFISCSDTEVLSGAWKSYGQSDENGIAAFKNKYIQMVIGHFGPEAAGVINYYEDSSFTIKSAADNHCVCSYIKNGKYSNGIFTFFIESPMNCKEGVKEDDISASFEYIEGGNMADNDLYNQNGDVKDMITGTFFQKEKKTELILLRDIDKFDITVDDKKCKN